MYIWGDHNAIMLCNMFTFVKDSRKAATAHSFIRTTCKVLTQTQFLLFECNFFFFSGLKHYLNW